MTISARLRFAIPDFGFFFSYNHIWRVLGLHSRRRGFTEALIPGGILIPFSFVTCILVAYNFEIMIFRAFNSRSSFLMPGSQ
jgi:hypothetical protein